MCYLTLRGVRWSGMPYLRGQLPRVECKGAIVIGRGFKSDGLQHKVELGAEAGGELLIGNDVFINRGSTISAFKRISIGDGTRIADLVVIADSDFHAVSENRPVKLKPIDIGRNVWIGRHAVVLPGVSIGDHSVIGAGSVVTESVPERRVAVGNPARVVSEVQASDGWVRS